MISEMTKGRLLVAGAAPSHGTPGLVRYWTPARTSEGSKDVHLGRGRALLGVLFIRPQREAQHPASTSPKTLGFLRWGACL